jgi:methionine-rich copper-binding protein CopC
MKQLIALAAICLLLAAASSANPLLNDKNPAKNKPVDDGKKEFLVLPDYKTGNATVSFKADKAGKATIVVLNEDGNTVIKQEVKLVEGKNKIGINNFTNLQEGYYTICLNTNYKSYSSPFLLWK